LLGVEVLLALELHLEPRVGLELLLQAVELGCIFHAEGERLVTVAAPEGRERIFAGIRAALVGDGVVVLQGYTPRQLQFSSGGPRDPEHLYTPELLRQSLGGFDIVHLREHDAVLSEGTKHVGEAALIDLVGRKRS